MTTTDLDKATAEIQRLLPHVRSGVALDPTDPLQGEIQEYVDLLGLDTEGPRGKRPTPVPSNHPDYEDTLMHLHGLLKQVTDRFGDPERQLHEDILWQEAEDRRDGRNPFVSPGDFSWHQHVDRRGQLLETMDIPGLGTRTRVLLDAPSYQELTRLMKAVDDRPIMQTKEQVYPDPEAVRALDSFCAAHNIAIPSRHITSPDDQRATMLAEADVLTAAFDPDLQARKIHVNELIASGKTREEVAEIIRTTKAEAVAERAKGGV